MSSSYSPDLRIQLMGPGDQAGTWGNTTNTNLGGIIENAIAGVQVVTVNSNAQPLTYLYGAPDQAQGAALVLQTGTVSTAFNIFTPTAASKLYVVNNQTSWTATFYASTVLGNTTPAGTGIAIPAGQTATIWTDGTNFYTQNTYLPGVITTGGALTVNGSVTASNHIGAGTGLTGTATSLSIGGNAATATSLQSTLAIAAGGTGATTAAGALSNLGAQPASTAITTSNYNSYSPTLTGSGASGTWGINISGNSGNVSGTVAVGNGGTGTTSVAGILSTLGFAGQSLANPGYYRFPNNLLVQWASQLTWATQSFPVTFSNILCATAVRYSGSGSIGEFGVTYNNTTITPATNGNTGPWNYIALGY